MRLLVTNDDGIMADGLVALVRELQLSFDCYVIAPDRGRSCCSHSVTTNAPIELKQIGAQQWSTSGTPADCVRIGLQYLQLQPDLVLSGINEGGNLGVDIHFSGTVAAAREASLCGYRAMALSQYLRRDIPRDWAHSARRARWAIDSLSIESVGKRAYWNINLPARPDELVQLPIVRCMPEPQHLDFAYELHEMETQQQNDGVQLIYRSTYQNRPRSAGTDVDTCFQGNITATLLQAGF